MNAQAPARPQKGRRRIIIEVPQPLEMRLREYAERTGLSLSEIVRAMLHEGLARQERAETR